MLISHFQVKSQMQVEYLDQQREIWSKFDSYFEENDPDLFETEEEDNNDLDEENVWSQLDDSTKT